MRIQILSTYFAPEESGSAPYVTGLAHSLSKHHDVTVIAGVPHYPQWRVAPEWRRWRAVERRDRLTIIRLAHYVPSKQDSIRRGLYESTWAARALAEGVRHPADVVIGMVPTLLTAHVATLIARRHRASVGLVVQDIVSRAAAQSGIRGGASAAGLAARIERSGFKRADGICTIHPRLAEVLVNHYGVAAGKLRVIYNWSHIGLPNADRATTRQSMSWPAEQLIALHSGNMGLKQDLDHIVAAARLAQSQGAPVRFVLAGDGNQRARIAEAAQGLRHLEVRDAVSNDDFPDFLNAADVLLINERAGVLEMSLPSKLTSYLAAGRPVLAATESRSATAEMVAASGGGIVTKPADPQALLDAVLSIGADYSRAHEMGLAGQRFAIASLDSESALASYHEWVEELGGS